ncbi:hypothetical protein F5B21DRAFT_184762 [Xylaria acuta]|nr:hypothetical protein F5B21DRAFT_184762 [Xylaria acuta]
MEPTKTDNEPTIPKVPGQPTLNHIWNRLTDVESQLKDVNSQLKDTKSQLKDANSQLMDANSRINSLQSTIQSTIQIPCPAKDCLKRFRNNSHRNRHIRTCVEKGPQREPRWKEHEDARKILNLDLNPASKEDPVSDNDTPWEDDMQLDPQNHTAAHSELATLQDNPPLLEVRSISEARLPDHSQATRPLTHLPVTYQVPLFSGLEPMHDTDNDDFLRWALLWNSLHPIPEMQSQIQNQVPGSDAITPPMPDFNFDTQDLWDELMLELDDNGGDPAHQAGIFDSAGR